VLAIFGTIVFLVIAPGFVAGLVPWWISGWRVEPPFFGVMLFRFAGALLIAVGLVGLLDSFARFALQGLGTPAPVVPTRYLVVTGPSCSGGDSGPNLAAGKRQVARIRKRDLAVVSCVRAGLRRAGAAGKIWTGVRIFLRRGPPLDSKGNSVERNSPLKCYSVAHEPHARCTHLRAPS
jgi:hypothetical protein